MESIEFEIGRWTQTADRDLTVDERQHAIRWIIDHKSCPLCTAVRGELCAVYGGFSSLGRTHPARLRMNRREAIQVVEYAVAVAAVDGS